MKICRENPNFLKVGQKYLAPYMKSYLRCIVTGVIKAPLRALFSSEMVSGCWDSRRGTNIMQTRHSVMF
jgi:flagellar motor component MotA